MKETLPKINKSVSYLRDNIASFTANAAGTNLSELQEWIDDEKGVEKFHSSLKKEQIIYTLLSSEKSKMIQRFFHVPKIESASGEDVSVKSLLFNFRTGGVLINGRLGQGKSVLLRYLHFLELNIGESIPVFLELRKIKNGSQILTEACQKINMQGLRCSNKLFDFLMSEGKISLFLDGYDEISLEARDDFNNHLSRICSNYPSAKLLVTSRYGTEVSKNPQFKRFEIKLLEKEDIAPFVKKILSNNKASRAILSKIKESDEFDYDVLDTPLMITWFIVVYNKRLKIPKTKLGFYEDLFSAILSRHDGFKDSYNRASKTKMSDDEIKNVFCAFCYLARREQKRIFTEKEIHSVIRKALNISHFTSASSSDYLYDLVHVTCLLKRDGLDYEFIHESIAHYFSALFIESQTESNVNEFYTNRIKDWRKFEGELEFLSVIDKVRFNQYFFIPNLLKVLGENGAFLRDASIHEMYSSAVIVIRTPFSADDIVKGMLVFAFPPDDYAIKSVMIGDGGYSVSEIAGAHIREELLNNHSLVNKLERSLNSNEAIRNNSISYCSLMGFLESAGMLELFINSVRPSLYEKFKVELEKAQKVISFEKRKGGLFS